jgi:DNA-binding transcriptional MerR regulator
MCPPGDSIMDNIPNKRFFKIGEVSRIVGVPTHVLRYWEREFSLVRPRRAPSKQRIYKRKDVEMLLHIKKLLHQEKYTIAGARKKLQPASAPSSPHQTLKEIKQELIDLRRMLD